MPASEDKAKENIDRLLTQSGWAVRDQSDANISAYRGVAVRNFTLKPGHGLCPIFSMWMFEPSVSRLSQGSAKVEIRCSKFNRRGKTAFKLE